MPSLNCHGAVVSELTRVFVTKTTAKYFVDGLLRVVLSIDRLADTVTALLGVLEELA